VLFREELFNKCQRWQDSFGKILLIGKRWMMRLSKETSVRFVKMAKKSLVLAIVSVAMFWGMTGVACAKLPLMTGKIVGTRDHDRITVKRTATAYEFRVKIQSYWDSALEKPKGKPIKYILLANDKIIIEGLSGSDTIKVDADVKTRCIIEGGFGDDTIYGGSGDDEIYGDSGNDEIHGGKGQDVIEGGDDDDFLKGASGKDDIYGGDGDDEIRGDSDDDNLFGGAGHDVLRGGAGKDILYGDFESYSGSLADEKKLSGNDELFGDAQSDFLSGGYGNDFLKGDSGFDIIEGGAGDDVIEGDNGSDIIAGGYGNDEIHGDSGNDEITGGPDDDVIFGGAGHDYINGSSGDDKLYGGTGSDDIYAGPGTDRLWGGFDVCLYLLIPGMDMGDRLYGGEESVDTIYVTGWSDSVETTQNEDVVKKWNKISGKAPF